MAKLSKRRKQRMMLEGEGFFGDIWNKGKELLQKGVSKVVDVVAKPSGFDPSQVRQGWVNRPADLPSTRDLAFMAKSVYGSSDRSVSGYTILQQSPYLTFYQSVANPNLIIVAIRGTDVKDSKDLTADLSIVRGGLQRSTRFQQDLRILREFQTRYPQSQYTYYGVAHSLGGAILDKFLNLRMISNGVSFNPAVEKEDYNRQNNNHRIYQTCDPLYKIMGQYITNGNIEVRNKDGGFGECHSVDTFSGGARNMDSFIADEDGRTKATGGAMPPRVAMGSQRFGMIKPMVEDDSMWQSRSPLNGGSWLGDWHSDTFDNDETKDKKARKKKACDKCQTGNRSGTFSFMNPFESSEREADRLATDKACEECEANYGFNI